MIGFESLGREVFTSFLSSIFYMVAEPEEGKNKLRETFEATLAIMDARRLRISIHGSNASNGSGDDGIPFAKPYALKMGDFVKMG